MTISYETILQAVARGWCSPKNENKVMDADLAEAIAIEVFTLPENHREGEPEAPLEEQP
jgi:hypothetical protein